MPSTDLQGRNAKGVRKPVKPESSNQETVPAKTSKPKDRTEVVPLARQAIKILRAAYALTGDDIYVFRGARDDNRPMSDSAILTAMRHMGITNEEMCGHGFRATARTSRCKNCP